MPMETCSLAGIAFLCVQLNINAPKFFGFSEFIAGLALMILVWTIVDVRYKFRIATATLPLSSLSLLVTFHVGVLSLLTDLWRAQQGWVPSGTLFTPETWQFWLATAFLLTIFTWQWSAFIRPATFNRFNSSRFVKALEASIMRGSPTELAIIADELSRSAAKIVRHATNTSLSISNADQLLLTMGSPKFCQATIEGAPGLISGLFHEMNQQCKYPPSVEIFTKNVVTAAVDNKASFLYVETDYYESGSEGISKTITSALCNDPKLVESIPTLLSPSYSRQAPWDIDQWRAYYRLVLAAFTSHIRSNPISRTTTLNLAWLRVTSIVDELNDNLQLTSLGIHDDLYLRLTEIGDLIRNMVSCLDDRKSAGSGAPQHAIDDIAELIFVLIKKSSSVKKPKRVAHRIQHELIWSEILNSSELRTAIGLQIQQKVHDKLESTIQNCPNLDSIKLLGYCLNVLGFRPTDEAYQYGASWRQFHMRLLEWIRKNIATLLTQYPEMASNCFAEDMRYDAALCRLVHEHNSIEKDKGNCEYLYVQPAMPEISGLCPPGTIALE